MKKVGEMPPLPFMLGLYEKAAVKTDTSVFTAALIHIVFISTSIRV